MNDSRRPLIDSLTSQPEQGLKIPRDNLAKFLNAGSPELGYTGDN